MPIQEQLVRKELANDIEKLPLPILMMFSAAIKEFLNQIHEGDLSDVAQIDELSFQSVAKKRPFAELFGEWNGQIWMSDDFDEPLEEMGEYM